MKYEDDPINIENLLNTIDFNADTFLLDDANTDNLPTPYLITIDSESVMNHTLMIP